MTFQRKGKLLFIATHLAFIATTATAVVNGVSWTSSPFNQKVFVENNGQFNGNNGNGSSKILFGISSDGVDLYFSKEGLMYRHDEYVPMSEEEIDAIEKTDSKEYEMEEKERMVKSVPHYLSIEWVGSNPAAEIIATNPFTSYYTYAAPAGTILAHAYKKIIYKNLYPHIDVEYVLPEGKEGIKYTIIVHPGGDVTQIKMRYDGASHLERDDNGNVIIKSSFGDFIDHAPTTSVNALTIPSSFVIHENEISFAVASYDKNETLVIDPWIINPTFDGYNAAYDVNYDHEGNVYAYGSFAPLKLAKFNSAGKLQWIFAATDFGKNAMGQYQFYGDFAVDEVSGTNYLVEGIREGASSDPSVGAKVLKVNTTGIQTGIWLGARSMFEMWRVEYNQCTNKLIIGGGGAGRSPNQAAMLDTNLVSITPASVLLPGRAFMDIALLAIDNESNFCFMGNARTRDGLGNNDTGLLIKCPIPNLLPKAFSVDLGHKFFETGSVAYVNGNQNSQFVRYANGMNGMAVSPNWLYTYDSDSLKRWNKNTGALVAMSDISPSAPVYGRGIRDGIQIFWGGLAVDDCDNLYIGLQKYMMKYDSSLTLRDSVIFPGMVYDVRLWPNHKLYTCGRNFVAQLDVQQQSKLSLTTTMPVVVCDSCGATATASVQTCTNNPAGFSYSWNTNPIQITQTATGLCPGTYTVTVSRNCSVNFIDSVTIINDAISLKPVITTIGKRPGEEMFIPILLTPSTKLTTAKEIELTVKYDPVLLRFVNVTSSVGTVLQTPPSNGVLSFTITTNGMLPTPAATIAELHMQALLAPYSEGEIEVTQSKITLESGEQITGSNCPATFTLDSSCVMPHDVRKRSSAEITGLYPNPSENNITLEVNAENDPDVRIEVYDAFGRQIKTVFAGQLDNGKNEIMIVTKNYANGIYFCRLVNGFKVTTKAFNVQR